VVWRTAARELVEELGGRRDLRATLRVVVDEIAATFHPSSGMSSPGHERLAAAIAAGTGRGSCDPSTVTRAVERLVEWGLVHRAAPGTILVGGSGGEVSRLRAEYGLTLPPLPGRSGMSGAGAEGPVDVAAGRPTRTDPVTGGEWWPMCRVPLTRGQRHAAARRLQREAEGLRGCSGAALAAALRQWFTAGWTAADVLVALDSRPEEGGRWTFTTAPNNAVAWVRFRLSWWRGEAGPGRSPGQRRQVAHEAAQLRHDRLLATAVAPAEVVTGARLTALAGRVRDALVAAQTGAGGRATGIRSDLPFRAQNADPSVSNLTVGESFTRARPTSNDGTPDGVRTGITGLRAATRAHASIRSGGDTAKTPGRPRPTLEELHSQRLGGPSLGRSLVERSVSL